MQLDSTTILIIIGAAITLGILMVLRGTGRLKTRKTSKSIDVLRPRDKRAFTMPIIAETEISLRCPKKEGVYWRFYKTGPGWTFPNGLTKFFGIEGTAYTAVLRNDKPVTMRLSQALQILWGIDDYKKMPPQMREIVEKHSIGVTISPEKIPDEDKTGSLSAANVDDENDQKAMDRLAKAMKDKGKIDYTHVLLGFLGGIVVAWIAVSMHWIRVA
jgi:hypothetical protein